MDASGAVARGARMKSLRRVGILGALFLGCGAQPHSPFINSPPGYPHLPHFKGGPFPPSSNFIPSLEVPGSNVMKIQVGRGQVCGRPGYINELCTEITLCLPGTDDCETIPDVLVDTGSVGLRLFSSTLHLRYPEVTNAQGTPLAECAQFGSGTDWGPLAVADIVMADQKAKNATIQVINARYATLPSICLESDPEPRKAGFNGILGVGLFKEDCGSICETEQTPTLYFACSGLDCTQTPLSRSSQVKNPISLLAKNNNGIVIALPSIGPEGSERVIGSLILGVHTQANNTPGQVKVFHTDQQGNFVTEFEGKILDGSFIDSGTNTLLFPNLVGLTACDQVGVAPGFYCPAGALTFSANMIALSNGEKTAVPFVIENAQSLVAQKRSAFFNIGAHSQKMFDWGLPFFYGKVLYEVIENEETPFGKGPYWAF